MPLSSSNQFRKEYSYRDILEISVSFALKVTSHTFVLRFRLKGAPTKHSGGVYSSSKLHRYVGFLEILEIYISLLCGAHWTKETVESVDTSDCSLLWGRRP